ncbi:MAG: hypothetical protein M0033_03260 [Nitrospiraceae bacterium]|nr:hypothetical protein [Nitrospiraceae bacterium]
MKGRTLFWFLERASGAALAFALAVHFMIIHFKGPDAFQHGNIFLRLSRPSWLAFYLVFLSALIYHGSYGLWGIAVEYVKGAGALKTVKTLLLMAATALFAAGLWVLADSQILLSNPPGRCYRCHAKGSIPSGRALKIPFDRRP